MRTETTSHGLVEINGDEPAVLGLVCQGIVAIEYAYAGKVAEEVNVVFLRFSDRWHRLYFDFGTVFWRTSDRAPESFDAEELDSTYRAVDLAERHGLQGLRLTSIRYAAIAGGAQVELEFQAGERIAFRCIDDITNYVFSIPTEVASRAEP